MSWSSSHRPVWWTENILLTLPNGDEVPSLVFAPEKKGWPLDSIRVTLLLFEFHKKNSVATLSESSALASSMSMQPPAADCTTGSGSTLECEAEETDVGGDHETSVGAPRNRLINKTIDEKHHNSRQPLQVLHQNAADFRKQRELFSMNYSPKKGRETHQCGHTPKIDSYKAAAVESSGPQDVVEHSRVENGKSTGKPQIDNANDQNGQHSGLEDQEVEDEKTADEDALDFPEDEDDCEFEVEDHEAEESDEVADGEEALELEEGEDHETEERDEEDNICSDSTLKWAIPDVLRWARATLDRVKNSNADTQRRAVARAVADSNIEIIRGDGRRWKGSQRFWRNICILASKLPSDGQGDIIFDAMRRYPQSFFVFSGLHELFGRDKAIF